MHFVHVVMVVGYYYDISQHKNMKFSILLKGEVCWEFQMERTHILLPFGDTSGFFALCRYDSGKSFKNLPIFLENLTSHSKKSLRAMASPSTGACLESQILTLDKPLCTKWEKICEVG